MSAIISLFAKIKGLALDIAPLLEKLMNNLGIPKILDTIVKNLTIPLAGHFGYKS